MTTSSNGNNFRVTGPLCRGIPRTKASNAELWCFLWSAPEYREGDWLKHGGRDKMDDILQTTCPNAFSWMTIAVSTEISLKFVPSSPIDNIPSLVQIMAWRLPGVKPLSIWTNDGIVYCIYVSFGGYRGVDWLHHCLLGWLPGAPLLTWISNHTHHNVWDEITYPFLNFNGATVEVWELISNFIPHFTEHMVTYPCWD